MLLRELIRHYKLHHVNVTLLWFVYLTA